MTHFAALFLPGLKKVAWMRGKKLDEPKFVAILDSDGFHDLWQSNEDNAFRFLKLMMTDRRELGRLFP